MWRSSKGHGRVERTGDWMDGGKEYGDGCGEERRLRGRDG